METLKNFLEDMVHFQKKGKLKTFHILNRMEMYQFYLKISKMNEKVNTIFISSEMLTSYFDVQLNVMRVKGLYSVYGCFLATIQCF